MGRKRGRHRRIKKPAEPEEPLIVDNGTGWPSLRRDVYSSHPTVDPHTPVQEGEGSRPHTPLREGEGDDIHSPLLDNMHPVFRELEICRRVCQTQCYLIFGRFVEIAGPNDHSLNPLVIKLGEYIDKLSKVAVATVNHLENILVDLRRAIVDVARAVDSLQQTFPGMRENQANPEERPYGNLELRIENIFERVLTKHMMSRTVSCETESARSTQFVDSLKPDLAKTIDSKLVANPKVAGAKIFEEIARKIDPLAEGIRVLQHRELKSGSVEFRCESQADFDKLKSKLSELENVEVKEIKKRHPQLIIHDIPLSLPTPGSLEKDLEDAIVHVTGTKPDAIRLAKYKPPNDDKQMAYVTIEPSAWRKLLDSPKISIGWCVCTAKEYVPLLRCKNCLGLGHVQKYCSNEKVVAPQGYCFHCRAYNWENRWKTLDRPENHPTFSKRCPTLRAHILKLHSKIDYGGEVSGELLRRLRLR